MQRTAQSVFTDFSRASWTRQEVEEPRTNVDVSILTCNQSEIVGVNAWCQGKGVQSQTEANGTIHGPSKFAECLARRSEKGFEPSGARCTREGPSVLQPGIEPISQQLPFVGYAC